MYKFEKGWMVDTLLYEPLVPATGLNYLRQWASAAEWPSRIILHAYYEK
jgi:hypothetical protein